MSIYVLKNGKKVRVCKYQCGQEVSWDNTNNFFIEPEHDNAQHTKERCLAFKEIAQDPNKKQAVDTLKEIASTQHEKVNHTITLEQVQRKLESIGIILNIERLLKE